MEHGDELRRFYENEGEEELRLDPSGVHYLEFLTATEYLGRFLPEKAAVLDSCAGTGAYSFYLARRGFKVTAGDVVPYNVEIMRQKQLHEPILSGIYGGDALNLSRFGDDSFDAALLMGALYHFPDCADRLRAVNESLRLIKSGGIFACTYMNRYAVILNNLSAELENIDEILRFRRDGLEGIFYASTPEETEAMMAECGVEKLCHVALDGMACFLFETANWLDKSAFERWRSYHLSTCEEPSLLGAGYHNMYIGRKA